MLLKNLIKSMEYKVIVSQHALTDLSKIYSYICSDLLNPIAAANLVKKIQGKINDLSFMPKRFAINDFFHFRAIIIGSYVVLFDVDDLQKEVLVSRILYGRMDVAKVKMAIREGIKEIEKGDIRDTDDVLKK